MAHPASVGLGARLNSYSAQKAATALATVAAATIHAMTLASLPRLKPAVVVVNEPSEETSESLVHPELNSASSFPTCCQLSLS